MTNLDHEHLDSLVERLHWHHGDQTTGKFVLINPDGPEAAATITALRAQIDRERADTIEAAAAVCSYIIKNYDVMKPDRVTYEPVKVQKAAKGMVSLAREDIRALHTDATRAAIQPDTVRQPLDGQLRAINDISEDPLK